MAPGARRRVHCVYAGRLSTGAKCLGWPVGPHCAAPRWDSALALRVCRGRAGEACNPSARVDWLGTISQSTYRLHTFAIALVETASIYMLIVSIGLALAFSIAEYWLVEVPGQNLGIRIIARSVTPARLWYGFGHSAAIHG